MNPPLGKASIDDGILDVLYRYRRVDNSQHTCSFARCRAGPSRKLGKIIGLMQSVQGFTPTAAIHQVVPFGDQIINGTTCFGLAKGHAAIHATCSLVLEVQCGGFREDLIEVIQADEGIAIGNGLALILQKTGGLTHGRPVVLPLLP